MITVSQAGLITKEQKGLELYARSLLLKNIDKPNLEICIYIMETVVTKVESIRMDKYFRSSKMIQTIRMSLNFFHSYFLKD